LIANNTGTVVILEPYQLKDHIKNLKRALEISAGNNIQIAFFERNEIGIATNAAIGRDYS
jgi:hypothetical protein